MRRLLLILVLSTVPGLKLAQAGYSRDVSGTSTWHLLKENFSVAGTGNADGSTITQSDYSSTGDFAGAAGGGIDVDYDDDTDVDSDDFDDFAACHSGPNVPQNTPACEDKRLDFDNDVDQDDFGIFQECYSGAGNAAAPECTGQGSTVASGDFVMHGRPVDVLADGHTLLYVRARYYDLKNGRWLQRDPLGNVSGSNLYEAFNGNATRFTDPQGLDSVEVNGPWLDYKTTGFQWGFARILVPGLVVIHHPGWPYAFLMKQQDAIASFDTGPFETDFSHPLEIMQKATTLAVQAGTQNRIIAIFDKEAARRGWVKPKDVTFGERAQHIRALAQQGLQRQVQDVGVMTQVAFTVTTGALAAPTGLGGAIVDVAATGLDVATRRTSVGTGAVVITATVGGALLHLRFADEVINASQLGRVRIAQNAVGSFAPLDKEKAIAQVLAEQMGMDVLLRGRNISGGDALIRTATGHVRAEFKTLEAAGVNTFFKNVDEASAQVATFPGMVVLDARQVSLSAKEAGELVERSFGRLPMRRPNLQHVFVLTRDGVVGR